MLLASVKCYSAPEDWAFEKVLNSEQCDFVYLTNRHEVSKFFYMAHPKKDYELLMRYLQGDAVKSKPVAVPEPSFAEEWEAAPQPALAHAPDTFKTKAPKPRTLPKLPSVHLPKLPQIIIRKKARLVIAVFASAALIFIVWKGYSFYQLSTDVIYNRLYIPYSSNNTGQPSAKGDIESYFNAANFVGVTMQSKKQPQLSDKEKLLTGLAYLHRADLSKAIKWLEPVANNFKSPYRQQAEFYVALAYLKNEDFDHSIEKLEKIYFTPSHSYHNNVSQSTISDIKMLKWR